MQTLSRTCQLLNLPISFLIILFNNTVKTLSSLSDHAREMKFLVQYFGHTKKGKSLGL